MGDGEWDDPIRLVGQSWDVWLTVDTANEEKPRPSSSSTSMPSSSNPQQINPCLELSNDSISSLGSLRSANNVEPSSCAAMPFTKAPCYGVCPSRDEFVLVKCDECGMFVKPMSYRHHKHSRHSVKVLLRSGIAKSSVLSSSAKSPPPSPSFGLGLGCVNYATTSADQGFKGDNCVADPLSLCSLTDNDDSDDNDQHQLPSAQSRVANHSKTSEDFDNFLLSPVSLSSPTGAGMGADVWQQQLVGATRRQSTELLAEPSTTSPSRARAKANKARRSALKKSLLIDSQKHRAKLKQHQSPPALTTATPSCSKANYSDRTTPKNKPRKALSTVTTDTSASSCIRKEASESVISPVSLSRSVDLDRATSVRASTVGVQPSPTKDYVVKQSTGGLTLKISKKVLEDRKAAGLSGLDMKISNSSHNGNTHSHGAMLMSSMANRQRRRKQSFTLSPEEAANTSTSAGKRAGHFSKRSIDIATIRDHQRRVTQPKGLRIHQTDRQSNGRLNDSQNTSAVASRKLPVAIRPRKPPSADVNAIDADVIVLDSDANPDDDEMLLFAADANNNCHPRPQSVNAYGARLFNASLGSQSPQLKNPRQRSRILYGYVPRFSYFDRIRSAVSRAIHGEPILPTTATIEKVEGVRTESTELERRKSTDSELALDDLWPQKLFGLPQTPIDDADFDLVSDLCFREIEVKTEPKSSAMFDNETPFAVSIGTGASRQSRSRNSVSPPALPNTIMRTDNPCLKQLLSESFDNPPSRFDTTLPLSHCNDPAILPQCSPVRPLTTTPNATNGGPPPPRPASQLALRMTPTPPMTVDSSRSRGSTPTPPSFAQVCAPPTTMPLPMESCSVQQASSQSQIVRQHLKPQLILATAPPQPSPQGYATYQPPPTHQVGPPIGMTTYVTVPQPMQIIHHGAPPMGAGGRKRPAPQTPQQNAAKFRRPPQNSAKKPRVGASAAKASVTHRPIAAATSATSQPPHTIIYHNKAPMSAVAGGSLDVSSTPMNGTTVLLTSGARPGGNAGNYWCELPTSQQTHDPTAKVIYQMNGQSTPTPNGTTAFYLPQDLNKNGNSFVLAKAIPVNSPNQQYATKTAVFIDHPQAHHHQLSQQHRHPQPYNNTQTQYHHQQQPYGSSTQYANQQQQPNGAAFLVNLSPTYQQSVQHQQLYQQRHQQQQQTTSSANNYPPPPTLVRMQPQHQQQQSNNNYYSTGNTGYQQQQQQIQQQQQQVLPRVVSLTSLPQTPSPAPLDAASIPPPPMLRPIMPNYQPEITVSQQQLAANQQYMKRHHNYQTPGIGVDASMGGSAGFQ